MSRARACLVQAGQRWLTCRECFPHLGEDLGSQGPMQTSSGQTFESMPTPTIYTAVVFSDTEA